MSQKELWDKKAVNFPRYNKEDDDLQQKVIKILKDENILNSNTTVLDIGCGTGVYTIPLAKEAKDILALDISSTMLELLEEDSWNHNVNDKIKTINSNWQEFESEEKFDLVFASLSAAFSDDRDFEKILNYSKKHICFLDFVNDKGSNFEELLFNSYKIDKIIFKDLENKKRWLNSKSIKYKTIPLENTYSSLIELDVAIIKIKEIINYSKNKINLNDEEIVTLLKPLMIGKKVSFVMNMNLELLFWENKN